MYCCLLLKPLRIQTGKLTANCPLNIAINIDRVWPTQPAKPIVAERETVIRQIRCTTTRRERRIALTSMKKFIAAAKRVPCDLFSLCNLFICLNICVKKSSIYL